MMKNNHNRMSRSMKIYLRDISKYKLLTPDEEIYLAERKSQGDQDAFDKLFHSNLRFVVSIAKKYQNQGVPFEDLINEGNLGLIEAIKRFDGTRGVRLVNYAAPWIEKSIRQALAEQSKFLRLSSYIFDKSNRVIKMNSVLEQKYGRVPSISELAEALNMSDAVVSKILGISRPHISLFAQSSQNSNYTILDVTPYSEQCEIEHRTTEVVEKALSTLPELKRKIIELYFGFDPEGALSLRDIGERFSLSPERIRSIIDSVLEELGNMPGIISLKR